jgi:hypothetical protein
MSDDSHRSERLWQLVLALLGAIVAGAFSLAPLFFKPDAPGQSVTITNTTTTNVWSVNPALLSVISVAGICVLVVAGLWVVAILLEALDHLDIFDLFH